MSEEQNEVIEMYPQKLFLFFRKLLKKLFLTALVLIILCIGCATGWYFVYYPKTPQYSLQLIKTSLDKHDLVTFEKHVDIDNLSVQIVEGYVSLDIKPEEENSFMEFMMEYAISVYPNDLKKQFRSYIGDPQYNFSKLDVKSKNIIRDVDDSTNFINSEIKKVVKIEKIEKTANIHLLVHNKKTNSMNILIVKMQQLPDDFWRVTDFVNLHDYMNQVRKNSSYQNNKKKQQPH